MDIYSKILDNALVLTNKQVKGSDDELLLFNYKVTAEMLMTHLKIRNKIIATKKAERYNNAIQEAMEGIKTHGLNYSNNIDVTLKNNFLNHDNHAEMLLLALILHYKAMVDFSIGLIVLGKSGLKGYEEIEHGR